MTRRALPRATAAAISSETLLTAEVVVDETNRSIRVGDGATPGGWLLARKDQVDAAVATANASANAALGLAVTGLASADAEIAGDLAAVDTRVGTLEDEVSTLLLAQEGVFIGAVTWAALAARSTVGNVADQMAEVTGPDAGTHTDPVVGGTVPNEGRYAWSASPAGFKRIGAPFGAAQRAAAEAAKVAAEDAAASIVGIVEKVRGPAMTVETDAAGNLTRIESPNRFWTPPYERQRVADFKQRLRGALGPGGLAGIVGRVQSEYVAFNAFTGSNPNYHALNEAVISDSFTFSPGPRVFSLTGTAAPYPELADFIGHYERAQAYSGSNPYGETVLAGFVMMVKRLAWERYGVRLSDVGGGFWCGLTGTPGSSAAGLLGEALTRTKEMIAAAPAAAKKIGRRSSGARIVLDGQGYQNAVEQTAGAVWEADVNAYHDAIEAQNYSIQGERIVHARVMSQLDTWKTAGAPTGEIALKQLEMETKPGFTRLVTRCQIALGSDHIHWTVNGGFEIGARSAWQWFERYVEGKDGVGIRLGDPRRSGNNVFVPIDFLDCSRFAGNSLKVSGLTGAPSNLSFEVTQSGGAARTISSAAFTTDLGQTGVVLALTTTPIAGDIVHHARTGDAYRSIAGVRDSDERYAVAQGGQQFPLYSYLPQTKKVVT